MSRRAGQESARERLRRGILEMLREEGPLVVRHLPAVWPWTRRRTQEVVGELIDDGLVVGAGPGNSAWTISLTEAGRRTIDTAA